MKRNEPDPFASIPHPPKPLSQSEQLQAHCAPEEWFECLQSVGASVRRAWAQARACAILDDGAAEDRIWLDRRAVITVTSGTVAVVLICFLIISNIQPERAKEVKSGKTQNANTVWRGPMPKWQGPALKDWVGSSAQADEWVGYTIMHGGKGYAATPMGQVHYRDVGPRNFRLPILLLHMTPMSMIQGGAVQNELAALGIRSVAIDTPGFGNSDLPPTLPTIEELADNLQPVLDHLQLRQVVVAGHHTGASIATSFAARYPDRVSGIILHGVPFSSEDEVTAFPGRGALRVPRTPVSDGSHLSRTMQHAVQVAGGALSGPLLDAWTSYAVAAFMAGPDISSAAAAAYSMAPDLEEVQAPGLILADRGDALFAASELAGGGRPDFEFVEFSSGSPLQLMAEPARWALTAQRFLAARLADSDVKLAASGSDVGPGRAT